jgi:hypothetical protein
MRFFGLKCFKVAATIIGHFWLKVANSDIKHFPQGTMDGI